jgi:hypothetical protein
MNLSVLLSEGRFVPRVEGFPFLAQSLESRKGGRGPSALLRCARDDREFSLHLEFLSVILSEGRSVPRVEGSLLVPRSLGSTRDDSEKQEVGGRGPSTPLGMTEDGGGLEGGIPQGGARERTSQLPNPGNLVGGSSCRARLRGTPREPIVRGPRWDEDHRASRNATPPCPSRTPLSGSGRRRRSGPNAPILGCGGRAWDGCRCCS